MPLSSDAIAETVFGVLASILLAAAAATLCQRRRRRRASRTAASELPDHQTTADIKLDPGAAVWIPELDREGAVDGPHELAGTEAPLEESRASLGVTEPCVVEEGVFEVGSPD